MPITFPGESAAYRAARDRLLESERRLRVEMEAVAAERRALPLGGLVADYEFIGVAADGAVTRLRLAELFGCHDALVVYSFMFPRDAGDDRPGPPDGETARLPLQDGPCPSCTALLDQFDGMARHSEQRVSLAIVARAPIEQLLTFAAERGWRYLRLLSAAGSSFSRDYGGEVPGGLRPMLNVFERSHGEIRHFWGSELMWAPPEPGQEYRHVGTLEPLWNLFDLTRAGRGDDWDEQLTYACTCHRPPDEGEDDGE
jgi:predicted dithiol-disulfide oxidoreductase (DUF899 family)